VGYVLSNSFLEIAVLFLAGIFKFPPPLTIPQILYLHLMCDGPPDLIFAFEPKEKDLMERKLIDIKKESILDRFLISLISSITIFVSLISIHLFFNFGTKEGNLKLASTLVFTTLGAIDLIYVISFKNLRKLIIKTENFFENKFLPFAILYGFLLLFFAIYFPPLQKVLNTLPLKLWHWGIVFSIGILTTFLLEFLKLIFAKSSNKT
jgi:Ca2+-transporting ATPase